MTYKEMIDNLGERWDQTPEDLEGIMGRISEHESGGVADILQTSGGPGRGLFQFEVGEGAGGATAGNRLMKYLGGGAPDWLTSMVGPSGRIENLDASQLTPEQQKMLFLGNYRMHPEASLKGVDEGNIGDFWGKYHWAGAPEGSDLYNKRLSSFNESQSAFNLKNEPTVDEVAFTGYLGNIFRKYF